jgi:DNA recombination protein RmuC
MEAIIVVLLVALLVVVGALVWDRISARNRRDDVQAQAQAAQMIALTQQSLEQRIEGLDQRLTAGLNSVQQTMNTSFASSAETMRNVGQQLGELKTSSAQMLEVGKNIGQLQDILKPPKMRGGFGELLLENLLTQIVPQNYEMQHRFRNGEMVDAVVRLGNGMVPVDSKFPMESFNRAMQAETDEERVPLRRAFLRDVRMHVDAVAKYIAPDEGTFEFALMYIPAEGVYYETFFRDEKLDEKDSAWTYAMDRRVIPVSPNSFFAYLQAVVLGLNGLRVEQRAQEIIGHLSRIESEYDRFREEFAVLGGHIGRAKTKFDEVDKHVGRLGDRLMLPLQSEWDALPQGQLELEERSE